MQEYLIAFAVGGTICALSQLLMDKTKLMPGRIMVILVVTGVVLGAFGIYEQVCLFLVLAIRSGKVSKKQSMRKGCLASLKED